MTEKTPSDAADSIVGALCHALNVRGTIDRPRMVRMVRMVDDLLAASRRPAIQPGDVVTLASGGASWTVARVRETGEGLRALIQREKDDDLVSMEPLVVVLRKVEPEPPARHCRHCEMRRGRHLVGVEIEPQSMDEETAVLPVPVGEFSLQWALRGASLNFIDEQAGTHKANCPEVRNLRRWLDAGAPMAAPQPGMDEGTRAALSQLLYVVSPVTDDIRAARDRLADWLDAQRGA